uniref:UDP-N-acetylmuramyl-tripeptide synthetase n=1 Tax=candidate division WWE3 bacterium TaxID=2053526 RepID=A0A832E1Q8_UNCKA
MVSREENVRWEKILAEVAGVADDSREVKEGDVFVAVSGSNFDGHDFIEEARRRGARWVVGERDLEIPLYVKVGNSRRALGELVSEWYGNPSGRMKVIGVTGTDGKTTTSHLLGEILNRAQINTEVLSTINVPGAHTTTPPAPVLQHLLAEAQQKERRAAVVEVTSHAIAQERIAGTSFSVAVLTNVTPEHLDYHETFERYRDTKARLFQSVPLAVLNRDDPSWDVFSRAAGGRVVSYGLTGGDFSVQNLEISSSSSRFQIRHGEEIVEVTLPLPGEYNVQNALAAVAAAVAGGDVSLAEAGQALAKFDSRVLVGRFEKVKEISDFSVVVDFAHTPAALAKVLNYVARFKPGGARLIVVFGAAGERDRGKRPQMGAVAGRTADLTILTSEDPRREDPEKIIDEIAAGCFAEGAVEGKNFVRIPDRRRAIRFALRQARPNDFVLVLGKGHETTMAIAGIEHPWSDRQVIKEEFGRLKR